MEKRFLIIASFADSLIEFRGQLIADLRSYGFEVHVALPGMSTKSSVRRILNSYDVVVHDIPLDRAGSNPLVDLVTIRHLAGLINRVRPRIVLAYTAKPVVYGLLAAWYCGVPLKFGLISGLGYAFTGNRIGPKAFALKCLYRLALRNVDKIFFQNTDDESLFRRSQILPKGIPAVVVAGSGVDLTRYSSCPPPKGPTRFLMIARLLGDKGVREYVQAAAIVRHRFPSVTFSLVGWIDDNPDSVKPEEIELWVESGFIDFVGRLEDVRPEIARCHVYVLPSYREGTPRTVLEAMAMARPIITTDAPGCRETVVHEGNGFLVRVKSVNELVKAMRRFIEEPRLIESMGAESRKIAEDRYDVHKVNSVMLKEMGIA